jgi:serine/threonine-protein kinase
VALKLLPKALSGDEAYLRRFQRESHVAARLREPHVIPIHDYGELDGQLFIDMRLVDGADIGVLLKQAGRIDPERAVYLIGQVAEALDAAHADQLVHRDIKPSNILVTPSDFVYVVDFGIARSFGEMQTSLTITGATIGTLHYMAPERFAGHPVDGRADVYSLACVLYECLTGIAPFGGKELPALIYSHLYTSPPQASAIVEGIPPALDEVIAHGMAKNVTDRFPTAGMLAAAASEALLGRVPGPSATQSVAPGWNQVPAPVWEGAEPAWRDIEEPAGSEPELVENRLAMGSFESPTNSMSAAGLDDWRGTPPPAIPPPVIPPPAGAAGEPARRRRRRRLDALIVASALVLGVAVTLIVTSVVKSNPGGTNNLNPAGAVSSGPGTGASAAASLAPPTVAEKVMVGGTPGYVQVAPNGKFAYVVDPGQSKITVLSTATNQVTGVIKIPQGPPQSVAFSPDSQTAYASIYTTGQNLVHLVAFIDTASGTVTGTVSVDNHMPGPPTVSPDGRYVYVPNHNLAMTGANQNTIDVIDAKTRTVVADIDVEPNPHWIVFGKNNGLIYVTDHMSTVITVVNASNNRPVKTIEVGETPHSIALSPDGRTLAITSFAGNQVYIVDTTTDKEVATIPVGRNPLEVTYSPDGRYIFTADYQDNTVTVIDAASNRVIAEVPAGKEPGSISVLPNGSQAYVSDEGDGTVEVLNLPG